MMQDVAIPPEADDPVAIALNDPAIHTRLNNAARAFLGKRGSELSPTQRAAEAEVVVQEAACRAWKRRDQFDASKDIVKWLVGFVIKVASEYARQRRPDSTRPTDESPGLEALAVDQSRPVEAVLDDKLLVAHLLNQLSPVERDIIQMKYWQGMTCAEIGQQIGINENTARIRLFRAIQRLKTVGGATAEGQS